MNVQITLSQTQFQNYVVCLAL